MGLLGANLKIIWLDDPWDEGNRLRAELVNITVNLPVPIVQIGEKYIRVYNTGTEVTYPVMVNLVFSGKLKPMLEEAGALDSRVL